MSEHTYTREIVDGAYNLDLGPLSDAVVVALPGKPFKGAASGKTVVLSFADQLTPAEVATLDAVVAAQKISYSGLDNARAAKFSDIDANTEQLILGGFAFKAQQFALTLEARTELVELATVKASVGYPVTMNTIDNTGALALADELGLVAFVDSGIAQVRAWIDSGTQLKGQVRAATTIAEVDAVKDNR